MRHRKSAFSVAAIESVERRLMLSTAHAVRHARAATIHKPAIHQKKHHRSPSSDSLVATPDSKLLGPADGAVPADGSTPAVAPFKPAGLRHTYGVDDISFTTGPNSAPVVGDGTGQTIAIVDAYNQPGMLGTSDPNFKASDLALFDAKFGLPDPPSFTIVNQNGGSTRPTGYNINWAIEVSLDVEWAHVFAPMASIVLVETHTDGYSDLFQAGINEARNYPGVTVVSMSFGGEEDNSYDGLFATPTGHVPITFVASTGDNGAYDTGYPALSPGVVAVGGTSLTTSDSLAGYGSEVVWNDANGATGGGPSSVEPRPAYQYFINAPGTTRTTPDVSLDAALATGVYVYDSSLPSPSGSHGFRVGGTSLSAPCWAGLVAVADQGRALVNLPSMESSLQTLPRLYQLPSADYHDITSGNNSYNGLPGYTAGVGYDLASGIGTPLANQLVPDLAGDASISGNVFYDLNGDGIYNGSDTLINGRSVYIDLNGNGIYDRNEPATQINNDGSFDFTDLVGGLTGTLRITDPPTTGYVSTTPAVTVTTSYASTAGVNFGYFPTTYTAAASFRIAMNSAGTAVQVFTGSTLTAQAPLSVLTSLNFTTAAGGTVTVDGSNGNPVPVGGINIGGASGVTVIGTPGNDAFVAGSGSVNFSGNPVTFPATAAVALDPGTGADSLTVNGGQLALLPATNGILTRTFSNLTIDAGSLTVPTAAAHANRTLLVASNLSVAASATLDLGGNDMVVPAGSLTAVSSLVASAYAGGTWSGTGITSTAAAADPLHNKSLAVIPNVLPNGSTVFGGPGQPFFDGYIPALASYVVVKFTYLGDANADGHVDGSDYSRLDNGYNNQLGGWVNGDFNYDGVLDASDYTLADNAFNTAGTGL